MTAVCLARRAGIAVAGLLGLALLGGCATLGGNVKGSFSCRAPDGICAPSSTIDDRALALISGDAGDTTIPVPAGPYPAPAQAPRATRTALSTSAPVTLDAQAATSRTREKVLRIVFQPYIDDRGRLHEASAVHAVVQSEWQAQALADATPIPDQSQSSETRAEVSLADAVDRAAPGVVDVAAIDPNLPDPDVVAAARARKPDPIEAIKVDVASRLTRGQKRRPTTGVAPAGLRTSNAAPTPSTPVGMAKSVARTEGVARPTTAAMPTPVSVHSGAAPVAAGQKAAPADLTKTGSGPEAVARVKASGAYRGAQVQVEESARNAVPPATGLTALTSPTLSAGSFPAAVPEDK